MSCILFGLFSGWSFIAAFIEVNSLPEFQKNMLESKECLVAIGLAPCIPCEKLKKKLIENEKDLPDIYYIDLKKYPRIRHVFSFKAVPYLAVYKNGEQLKTLTGESSCSDYIFNIGYSEQK
jgi:thiol-disulfide isomerase/thioredoxin